MKYRTQIQTLGILTTALATGITTQAAVTVIQENFDNYGTSATQLSGQTGGSNFSAGWTNVGAGAYGYAPTNLTVANTGYVNTGETGTNDGAASNNGYAAGLNGMNSTRAIARPTAYLGVTGNTVWFSYTAQLGAVDSGNNAYFNLFNTSNMFATGNFVTGIAFTGGATSTFGTYQDFSTTNGAGVTAGTTYLFVGSVTVNPIGNDTLSVWYNPSDVSSIGAMGGANFTNSGFNYSNNNAFLAGMTVGIRSGSTTPNNNFIDGARIAYGDTSENNFNAVIVPEPSTSGLMLLGAIGLLLQRRRSGQV